MTAIAPIAPPSIASLSQATRAYAAATDAPAAASSAAGGGFADMVGNAMHAAIGTLHASERTTARGVAGKADVQEVVQAASDAEVTVQATVGILGKVTAAYSDIMHMSA